MSHAGNIEHRFDQWKCITEDESILETVKGYKLEFSMEPFQIKPPSEISFSESETYHIDVTISDFLQRNIIERTDHSVGEFISNIFVRPNRNGVLDLF